MEEKAGVNTIYFRGYILIRLKIIGTQLKVLEKVKELKSISSDENWKITYATPLYGAWDFLIECVFSDLPDMEEIISFFRNNEELKQWVEATTTLIGLRKNYQL
ncbi:MAG: hypothetical protein ACFFA6_05775 [Promethearchaeota archaeon]